jgi:beta-glucosidase-like glycosyl hydrolase
LKNTPLFPWNMMLGAVQDNELIRLYGEEVGRECNELGVHINFAPVLDVNVNAKNPVIGSRSYGENQQSVAAKGIAYSRGLESRKVIAVGKHFPGHGDTADDSHVSLPKIPHDRSRLDQVELYPFKEYIRSGFSGVMTGHLSVPALDNVSKLPTSLSPVIISQLLQGELGFTGLTFTDALVMKGADSGNRSVCVQALLAGNDVLLSPGKPATEFAAVKKAVEDGVIPIETIEEKCIKILRYKYITGLNNYKPIPIKGLKTRINSSHSDWLVQKLNEEAITLLKNENNVIPIKKLGENKIAVLSMGENKESPFQKTMD